MIGIYVIIPQSVDKISCNWRDAAALPVNNDNIKIGKAMNFQSRLKDYNRSIGEVNHTFIEFDASKEELKEIEKDINAMIRKECGESCKSPKGRRTEWFLQSTISKEQAVEIIQRVKEER